MAKWEHDSSPFVLLGIEWEAESNKQPPSVEEVKKAYRRQAKEKHPDKNPDNPNAKDEFDLIKRAHDFLLDEHKFNVYIAELRSKAFHFSKRKSQKESRRKMVEDLEQRECAFVQALKRQRTRQDQARDKLKEEREKLQQQMQKQQEWLHQARKKEVDDDVQAQLKRTFKVTWDRRCGEYTGQQLRQIFHDCGEIEDVVITTTKRKKGSALILMKNEENLSKVQSQGHFGNVENPLLIIIGDKNKKHEQPNVSQNEQYSFSQQYRGFASTNSAKQSVKFEQNQNFQFANQQQQQQQQQQSKELPPQNYKSYTQQDSLQGKPLFPIQNHYEEQQFSGRPLFPVAYGAQTEQFSKDKQQEQQFEGDNVDEIEDQQFKQPQKTSPLFPIQ